MRPHRGSPHDDASQPARQFAGGEPVVTTWLELTEPGRLRPADVPQTSDAVEVVRVHPPDGATNRRLYLTVGARYAWTDHAGRDDAWWQARAEAVETWVLRVGGDEAGYAELERDGEGGVEVASFGLLGAFHGRGLGGHLLTVVLRRALGVAPRVWVHTCTLDGPAALPNYLARGMRPFASRDAPKIC